MSSTQQTSLHFTIKESVRFFRGQGIQEMLMIELTPDISIYEQGETVYIQGHLLLAGEYIPNNISIAEEKSLREISGIHSVEQILEREDGTNEMHHSFPVNVSIPREKVENVADVFFTVDNFDYELEEQDQLFVTAEITIGGLEKEREEETFLEDEEMEEDEEDEEIEEIVESEEFPNIQQYVQKEFEPIQYDRQAISEFLRSSYENEEIKREHEEEIPVEPYQQEEEEYALEEVEEVSLVEAIEEIAEEGQVEENIVAPTLQEFQIEVKKEAEVKPLDYHRFTAPSLPNIALNNKKKATSVEKEVQHTYQAVQEDNSKEEPKQEERTNTSVLASLFQNSSSEKEYSKLKMYFVQKGDSLDDIALRYGVSVSAIQRVNELEDAFIDVGKLLYIPIYNQ